MSQLIPISSTDVAVPHFCGHCGNGIDAAHDNFCRNCGTPCRDMSVLAEPDSMLIPAELLPPATASPNQAAQALQTILNSRALIFGLVAILGPLGLPAVWFSPRFSQPAKLLITLGYLLLMFVVPLVFFWYALEVPLQPLVDAFER